MYKKAAKLKQLVSIVVEMDFVGDASIFNADKAPSQQLDGFDIFINNTGRRRSMGLITNNHS